LTAPRRLVYAESGMGRPTRKAEILITREWCKGCRICVEFCPEGVLGLDAQEKAVVLDAEACTACMFCELHCPDLAVEVRVGSRRVQRGREALEEERP
jgi:2-oxoglutarate ferredoxin oxidoreductase subunit delta